jgi:hypothetical protein
VVQALLKLYGNCTYVIEPHDKDYATCRYVGGGQYDLQEEGVSRRLCTTYSREDRLKQGPLHPQNDCYSFVINSRLGSHSVTIHAFCQYTFSEHCYGGKCITASIFLVPVVLQMAAVLSFALTQVCAIQPNSCKICKS